MRTIANILALTKRPARVKGARRRKSQSLAAAAVLCLASASASAACRTADLAGRWDFYLTAPATTATTDWAKCAVQISAGGAITRQIACFGGDLTMRCIAGRITLSADCRTDGRITIRDGRVGPTFAVGDFGVGPR